MKSLLAAALLTAAMVAGGQPQLPPPFPRTNATQLFENDAIRIWDIVWPKGQPTAMHRHIYDQVGTYYAPGGRKITQPDGEVRTNFTEVGSLSTTRQGTTHIEEGTTDPPLRAVFIELKRDGPSGLPAPADGRAESLPHEGTKKVLDDQRVAAWDVAWGSGPEGLVYRSGYETVIVWLGDGTAEVTAGGTMTSVPVRSGTMRHLQRGPDETVKMRAGSPRALIFQLK